MKHLCDTCCDAMDGAPDIHRAACNKGYQLRGPSGEIVKCSNYDSLPEVQINLKQIQKDKTDKLINDPIIKESALKLFADGQEVGTMTPVQESNDKKPPLGARPYYIASGDRIHELAEAISRHAGSPNRNLDSMRKWAMEIIAQCDLIEKMEAES